MFIPEQAGEGTVGKGLNQSRQLHALGLSLIAEWIVHDSGCLGEIEIEIK